MKNRPWSEAGKAQKAKVSSKLAGTWVLFNSLSYSLSSLLFLPPPNFDFLVFLANGTGIPVLMLLDSRNDRPLVPGLFSILFLFPSLSLSLTPPLCLL